MAITEKKTNPRRARAALGALRREGSGAASSAALSRQTKSAARRRGRADLRRAARKAAATRSRES